MTDTRVKINWILRVSGFKPVNFIFTWYGPYLQWRQNAKVAALVGGILFRKLFKWKSQGEEISIHILWNVLNNIVLYGIWNNKTSRKFLKVSKTRTLPLDDSAYPSSEISCNFFMPIIAKHQTLHRPSIQIPPTITAIIFWHHCR